MKKVLKWGLIVFIGLGIVGAFLGGEDEAEPVSGDPSKMEEKKEKKEEIKTVGVGDLLTVGKVGFIVHGVENGIQNVGGEDAKGSFVIVDVSVKNNGNEAITTDSSFFKLKADGKEFEASSTATMYANNNGGFFLEQVNPSLENRGKVVFDVPAELVNGEMVLNVQTGFWGTEQGEIKLK